MKRLIHHLGLAKGLLLALTTLAVLPGSVQAAWLGFRNDLKTPIAIQTVTVVNGIAREKPRILVLYPGEVSLDPVLQPVNKQIVIADGKMPKRILYQDTIPVTKDLFYSVQ